MKLSRDDVMVAIRDLHRDSVRFPYLSDIAAKLSISPANMTSIMRQLAESGHVRRVGNNYQLPETKSLLAPRPAEAKEVVQIQKEPAPSVTEENSSAILPNPTQIPTQTPDPVLSAKTVPDASEAVLEPPAQSARVITSLRWALGVIGVFAAAVSMYFNWVWNNESKPVLIAGFLSVTVVAFTVLAFELMVLLWGQLKRVLSIGVGMLWIVALAYSAGSIIGGQYDVYIHAQAPQLTVNAATVQAETANAVNASKVADLKTELKGVWARMQPYLTTIAALGAVTTPEEAAANRIGLVQAQTQLAALDKSASVIQARLDALPDAAKVAAPAKAAASPTMDAYTWAASVVGGDPSTVQFWMSVFPAVFCDVMAPVALAVALFLRPGKKKPQRRAGA